MRWQEALLPAQLHYLMVQSLAKTVAQAVAAVVLQHLAEKEPVLAVLCSVTHADWVQWFASAVQAEVYLFLQSNGLSRPPAKAFPAGPFQRLCLLCLGKHWQEVAQACWL